MIQETNGHGIVNAQCLSHGTIACRDLMKSRRVYEEFLGLQVVHNIHPATASPWRLFFLPPGSGHQLVGDSI